MANTGERDTKRRKSQSGRAIETNRRRRRRTIIRTLIKSYLFNPILKVLHILFNSPNNPIWTMLLLSSFNSEATEA